MGAKGAAPKPWTVMGHPVAESAGFEPAVFRPMDGEAPSVVAPRLHAIRLCGRLRVPWAGLEPATFRSGGGRPIHWATKACPPGPMRPGRFEGLPYVDDDDVRLLDVGKHVPVAVVLVVALAPRALVYEGAALIDDHALVGLEFHVKR